MTTRRQILAIIIVVGCLLIIEIVSPLRRVLTPLENAVQPLAAFTFEGTQRLRQAMASVWGGTNDAEIQALRDQVASLGVDRAQLATLEADNAALRATLAFKESSGWSLVTTRVIGRDPAAPTDVIIIGAGRNDGVMAGAAVVNAQGLLVAVVDTVGDVTSTARFIRARNVKLSARVINRPDLVGLLESKDGLSLQLEELPKEGDLSVGDVVATSAEAANVEPGIPIGSIVSISGGAEDLWRQAVVAPLASLDAADVVSVVLPTSHAP